MDPFMETKERIIRLQLPGGILDLSWSFYFYNEGENNSRENQRYDMAIELKRGTAEGSKEKETLPRWAHRS